MSMLIPNMEEFIPAGHAYRKMLKVLSWDDLTNPLKKLYWEVGAPGHAVSVGFRCLLLQFMLDRSDRQMEEHLRYDLSAKYFCGFGLKEETPDHSYFGKFRKRVGAEELAKLFKRVSEALKRERLIKQVFTFIDASEIHARVNVWEARDKALSDKENEEKNDEGEPTMNNRNVDKYSSDPEARFGCKGKDKIWYGYKRHVAVDMSNGLIAGTEVTPANTPDAQGIDLVAPTDGMVFGDKAYCSADSQKKLVERGCHPGVILKNNMKEKNRDKDRWLSSVRMPFEAVFARMSKRARYRGLLKNKFQALMQAFAFNIKRLVTIGAPPLSLQVV